MHIIVFYFILLLIKTFSLVKTYLSILCMYLVIYVSVCLFICLFIYLFTYLFAVRLNLADADNFFDVMVNIEKYFFVLINYNKLIKVIN